MSWKKELIITLIYDHIKNDTLPFDEAMVEFMLGYYKSEGLDPEQYRESIIQMSKDELYNSCCEILQPYIDEAEEYRYEW